jgi:hypothetical protein
MKVAMKCSFSILLVASLQSPMAIADEQGEAFLERAEVALLDELDDQRGRGGEVDIVTLNNQNVAALLRGNTAINNATGHNMIDNGSFAGASGLISVVQNSGNNVIIQDSTIVNVTIVP